MNTYFLSFQRSKAPLYHNQYSHFFFNLNNHISNLINIFYFIYKNRFDCKVPRNIFQMGQMLHKFPLLLTFITNHQPPLFKIFLRAIYGQNIFAGDLWSLSLHIFVFVPPPPTIPTPRKNLDTQLCM